MNEKINKLIKNPKVMIAAGLIGIVMIFLSSIFSSDNKEDEKTYKTIEYSVEDYRTEIENSIKDIVESITGDKNSTVVVTLESGIRYSYASAAETDSSVSNGDTNNQSSESKKQSYITVKTSDGGEQALIVTSFMPEVRGVAIICSGGNDTQISEKIENAVISALNITSKRVYVSGGFIQ